MIARHEVCDLALFAKFAKVLNVMNIECFIIPAGNNFSIMRSEARTKKSRDKLTGQDYQYGED